jgi:hypothetical protein
MLAYTKMDDIMKCWGREYNIHNEFNGGDDAVIREHHAEVF